MSSTQLSGSLQVSPQGLADISSTQNVNIGELIFSNDGRAYRYGKAGASDIAAGVLVQAAAEVTANQNLTAVAASVGDTSLVSTSTVTVVANQYAGGYAIITTGPGIGHMFRINGHAAFTGAAPTFVLADPINIALTTSSKIDLVANPFMSVIINPTTATSAPVGVNPIGTLTTLYFGWFQVGGVAPILADGALVVGTDVCASNGTAGTVEPLGQQNVAGTQALVGTAFTGVATTEVGAVRLKGLI